MFKKMSSAILFLTAVAFIFSCAKCEQKWAGMKTEAGADWLVVQYLGSKHEVNCWGLTNKTIMNEDKSDGIWWISYQGNLIHISGWYNYVQVHDSNFESAYELLDVDPLDCISDK